MSKLSQRMFWPAVVSVSLGSACGGDETVPLEPVSYEVSVSAINGRSAKEVSLRCDGTLSVEVSIAPADSFTLRPLHACGSSTRCGYVHFELLGAGDELVASSDSATAEGLLRVPSLAAAESLRTIRVSLRSGVNGEPIVNADGDVAEASLTPMFTPPTGCDETGVGGAGGGDGAGGSPGAGGAGPEPSAGAGGFGGAAAEPSGGAGGEAISEPQGGAGGEPAGGGAGGA